MNGACTNDIGTVLDRSDKVSYRKAEIKGFSWNSKNSLYTSHSESVVHDKWDPVSMSDLF